MSAANAAASAAALSNRRPVSRSSSSVQSNNQYHHHLYSSLSAPEVFTSPAMSRYETQKRIDWNHFVQYLRNHHRPPFKLSRCSGAHVMEFLRYLNQTKVHTSSCPYSGISQPPPLCSCPLRGSNEALVGRLRVAFEENGGLPEMNPFSSHAVGLYLEELRNSQAKTKTTA